MHVFFIHLYFVSLFIETTLGIRTLSQLFISFSGMFALKWCSGRHTWVNLVINPELAPRLSVYPLSSLQTHYNPQQKP